MARRQGIKTFVIVAFVLMAVFLVEGRVSFVRAGLVSVREAVFSTAAQDVTAWDLPPDQLITEVHFKTDSDERKKDLNRTVASIVKAFNAAAAASLDTEAAIGRIVQALPETQGRGAVPQL